MDGKRFLTSRRSIRKYKNELVDRDMIEEILKLARFYPIWGEEEVAKFTIVQKQDVIDAMVDQAIVPLNRRYGKLSTIKNMVIISYVKRGDIYTINGDSDKKKLEQWENFYSGLACHQFTLSAHYYGVGASIYRIIKEDKVKEIAGIPEDEKVVALISFGYPDEEPEGAQRKPLSEIARFIR